MYHKDKNYITGRNPVISGVFKMRSQNKTLYNYNNISCTFLLKDFSFLSSWLWHLTFDDFFGDLYFKIRNSSDTQHCACIIYIIYIWNWNKKCDSEMRNLLLITWYVLLYKNRTELPLRYCIGNMLFCINCHWLTSIGNKLSAWDCRSMSML